jgi:hypothetical protein
MTIDTGLAVERATLTPIYGIHIVLGHPAPVLAAGDGSFAVSPLAQRYSSFSSSSGSAPRAWASLRIVLG